MKSKETGSILVEYGVMLAMIVGCILAIGAPTAPTAEIYCHTAEAVINSRSKQGGYQFQSEWDGERCVVCLEPPMGCQPLG